MRQRSLIKFIIFYLLFLSSFVAAVDKPIKHRVFIINNSDSALQYVVINKETELEYTDSNGNTTYDISANNQAYWPSSNDVSSYSDISSSSVSIKIWQKELPLMLYNIRDINLNDACSITITGVNKNSIFSRLQYQTSPYCTEKLPEDFTKNKN